MLRRIIAEMVSDSDRQLAVLYAYLGKFLYENMGKARLYYCFTPENEHLESEAEMLLKRITGDCPSPLQESLPSASRNAEGRVAGVETEVGADVIGIKENAVL